MRINQLKNRGVRANCAYCKYSGQVDDFMTNCSNEELSIEYKRSVGYRRCIYFTLDNTKYNNVNSLASSI